MEMLAAEWRRREAEQAAAATVAAAHIAALESKARKVTFGCRTTAQAHSWSPMCSLGTRGICLVFFPTKLIIGPQSLMARRL